MCLCPYWNSFFTFVPIARLQNVIPFNIDQINLLMSYVEKFNVTCSCGNLITCFILHIFMRTFLVLNDHCRNWETPEGHQWHVTIQRWLSPLSLPFVSFQHKVQMLGLILRFSMTLPLSIPLASFVITITPLPMCSNKISLTYNSPDMSVTHYSLCLTGSSSSPKSFFFSSPKSWMI